MRTITKETKLSTMSPKAQSFILAQITRNQYALDYWMAALSTLKELPFYKREVKRMYGIIQREVNQYNHAIRGMIHKEENDTVDGYDMLLDNTYEFHEELKKQIYFYEQAVSRVIQKHRLPHASFLCQMSTSKDLLDLVAFVDGMEIHNCPDVENIGRYGGFIREMPLMSCDGMVTKPTVMGHFVQLCAKMNMLMLKALGVNLDVSYTEESDPETFRTSEIVTKNLINTLMDYKTLMIMYEDEGGKTVKEARDICHERIREKEAEIEKEVKRQAHKEELKKAKKAAKSNNNN